MCSKGFFKRIVPFFLTFAVGLFIASFFVTVAAPSFKFNKGSRRHREYHRTMEIENQRLREQNFRLQKELSDKDEMLKLSTDNLNVTPPQVPSLAPVKVIRR